MSTFLGAKVDNSGAKKGRSYTKKGSGRMPHNKGKPIKQDGV